MIRNKIQPIFLIACCLLLPGSSALAASGAKPIIGINVDLQEGPCKDASVPAPYFEAIEKSGGIPILIPPMPEEDLRALLKRIDGVMLIGGWDYPPEYYGQKAHASDHVMEPRRATFDKLLAETVVKDTNLPFLGVCAGSQILNISQGGNLIQDIPSARPDSKISHRRTVEGTINKHVVVFKPGTRLAALYETKELAVPANHHQAVDKIGAGLSKAAESQDGFTEAIEMESKPFVIGVQYHPERDYTNNQGLFNALIEEAKKQQSSK